MRFRGKSIRRKIVALLLVPLVSLTAIWVFATVLTGREASRLFSVSTTTEKVGYPVEDTIRGVQQERRQSLVYLADPRAAGALDALRRTRTATDKAAAELRRNAKDSDLRDSLDQDDNDGLTAVLDALGGVDALRTSVDQRTVTRAQALDLYNHLVDPGYELLAKLDAVDSVEMDKQYRALVNVARARELVSREDALLGSALVAGRLTRAEIRAVSDLEAQREAVYAISLPQLPDGESERFERFWANATTAPLRAAERAVVTTEPGDMPRGVTARGWDTAAGDVLQELGTLDEQANDRYQDRVRPVAVEVILKVAVGGVLGLVAVLLSLFLSVRIGRSLIRDLRQLRLDAHEASGVRLPSVMRRLSAGEQVDVETEVPRLEYEKNEIGEVAQALNTLQRAAVEAAVKQAELRAGVSEVFVNLARRSQVLLHKQLTLLDTMERRTEDTDELADLFRLDHLTTRMRRHAEGLVILSGAAPSRQWRKPVQLMDIVRAAVAEVEDYERIEVRRLPRVAVTGPAVADLTHLVAELLENATVFSPPHTAVQVLGERVANGFTLEIHDRGLGMAPEALLDANLRLAETPEFELSDTDRLGLFVVSRLAQRQNVRVSLQPSPYGGTTAVVFIPDALLTDDVPDTNGIGFRLDRPRPPKEKDGADGRTAAAVQLPGLPAPVLDGPVELEAPVDLDALAGFPDALDEDDGEHGGLFLPRHPLVRAHDDRPAPADDQPRGLLAPLDSAAGDPDGPVVLPRRTTPKLVSSHGRPVGDRRSRRGGPDEDPARRTDGGSLAPLPTRRRGATAQIPRSDATDEQPTRGAAARTPRAGASDERPTGRPTSRPDRVPDGPSRPPALPQRSAQDPAAPDRRDAPPAGQPSGPDDTTAGPPAHGPGSAPGGLPRRVRQANLAPQLREGPARRTADRPELADRDADEVRSRMASLQRGWQRGRAENAEGDDAHRGTAPQGTKGDGR
ncbi:nitrate- and nitrite sensing domain-containing protein [Streptomyces longwoodensis]|uniref:nitrate- and nitrite sensing domain-containing protein n=1 Tax=Streptomyces longwoodensis TaxID=68231 RepID=UPI002E80A625|nr:nitrate- and nitrite sensing domain-containing protein [Streptomyces longwoodensis]WUC60981.1 nitrate- and nitrite sensing domain-containing protein [Streptomyces longwoodensis]